MRMLGLVSSFLLLVSTAFAQQLQPLERILQESLERDGGNFVIPAGTYTLNETIELDLAKRGAVAVRADGPVTVTMNGPGPAFRFIGTHTGTAGPTTFQPETWKQRMPLIDGLEILGGHPEADGIELTGTVQAVINRVAVRKVHHGIHLVNRNRNIIISDCHLYENSGIGLYLDDVNLHQINVANSHISYNRQGGIVVRDGNVRNLHVTGCDIEANMPADETPTNGANILIDQSAPTTDRSIAEIAITGCTIQHSAHYGPSKVAPGGANIRILGNDRHRPNMITITGNVMSDTTTHVHLNQVMDVTLVGNTFFTTEPTDLLIEESRRVIVTGNAFNPREEGATGGVVVRDSSHCLLMGLTLHDIQAIEGAILLDNCRYARVAECIVSDSLGGISLRDCENCSVTGCTITGLPVGREAVTVSGGENRITAIESFMADPATAESVP